MFLSELTADSLPAPEFNSESEPEQPINLGSRFRLKDEEWVGRPVKALPSFTSPLKFDAWAELLAGHPNPTLVVLILDAIRVGVRIGFEGSRPSQPCLNHLSVHQHSAAIADNIHKEVDRGRIAGPFIAPPFAEFSCSPLGAVPKKDSGKVRRIHDLSAPRGGGVNDGIADGTVDYARFDDAINIVRSLGRGCFLWKTDLADAFRHIAVHRDDVPLLGFCWAGLFFFDLFLPFGLRSSPKLFEAFATALHWIAAEKFGLAVMVHYLDDFLGGAPAHALGVARAQFELFLRICRALGLSVNPDKVLEPRSVIAFLGLEIDTVRMVVRLPADKLAKLRALLAEFAALSRCRVKKLESLIGTLSFACNAVRPGRTFLRRMLDTLKAAKQQGAAWVNLGVEFKHDLEWWRSFAAHWNGRHCIVRTAPEEALHVSSDASDIGAGAFHQNRWWAVTWSDHERDFHIDWRELRAVLLAASAWCDRWRGRHVVFHVDNTTVVAGINKRASGSAELSGLLRSLHMIAACFEFEFSSVHVPGVHNGLADALSRQRLEQFRSMCPKAFDSPDQPQLPRILCC